MHFIFLGPGETSSWDAWLFATQLALALAAVLSPFIAHQCATRRERKMAADAMARQRRAERVSNKQLAREKSSYSDSVFYAIHLEASRIRKDVDGAKSVWHDSGYLPTGDIPELQIDVPSAMGSPSLWTHLIDAEKLRDTVALVNTLAEYNNEISRIAAWVGTAVTEKAREEMQRKVVALEEAVEQLLKWNPPSPKSPYKGLGIL